jgi:light-regulated signal transduction histidine kinase (bacteriophytochrome)
MRHQRSQPRKLSVTTALGPDDSVRLVVADSGPGIDAERLDRVFEPFYTTKDSGLGLGLAISRTIARAHGGSLSAESHDGHGATLRLTLPRATSARTAHASAPAVDVPAGQGEETLAERRHHNAESGGAEPGRMPTATAS